MIFAVAPAYWIGSAIVTGVVGLGCYVMHELAEEERRKRDWKYEEAEHTIREERRKVKEQLQASREKVAFHSLAARHFASVQASSLVYAAISEIKAELAALRQHRVHIKGAKELAYAEMQKSPPSARRGLKEQWEQWEQWDAALAQIQALADQLHARKQRLYAELKQLNAQTRELKLKIRDTTGQRGREWFNQLEGRSLQRRAAEGG